jgi:uncharacterized membrane protein
MKLDSSGARRPFLRSAMTIVLFVAGLTHLVRPDLYLPAMPDYIPWHSFWVAFTGWLEIAAAIGLWLPRLGDLTALCLVVYFIAILPAHFHVAQNDIPMFGLRNPWLWIRIPFQAVFIVWAWRLKSHEG